MGYVLGNKSRRRLYNVHTDLVSVVERAISLTKQDFSVIEGLRSVERQRTLFNKGATKTMNSRHLTGHAVDLMPYPFKGDIDKDGIVNFEDWDQYYPVADAMISAAKELDIPLRWGGNWRVKDLREWYDGAEQLAKEYPGDFPDGPHFELPRGLY